MRTDIAGFVGFAERGPLPEDFAAGPVRSHQGRAQDHKLGGVSGALRRVPRVGYLAYAVRAFFENGGDTCYVVRVAATPATDPAQNAIEGFIRAALPGRLWPIGTWRKSPGLSSARSLWPQALARQRRWI